MNAGPGPVVEYGVLALMAALLAVAVWAVVKAVKWICGKL